MRGETKDSSDVVVNNKDNEVMRIRVLIMVAGCLFAR